MKTRHIINKLPSKLYSFLSLHTSSSFLGTSTPIAVGAVGAYCFGLGDYCYVVRAYCLK